MSSEKKVPPRPAFVEKLEAVRMMDDKASAEFPILCQALWPITPEEGPCRVSGSLNISCDGSLYVLRIQMPSEGLKCEWRTETLIGVLERLERFLRSPEAKWGLTWEEQKKRRQGS